MAETFVCKNSGKSLFASSKSAERNEQFVSESLAELLKDNSVIGVDYIPHVVNLLSLSTNASGKQRLILDLKYVNNFLYKENYPQGLKSICLRATSQIIILHISVI